VPALLGHRARPSPRVDASNRLPGSGVATAAQVRAIINVKPGAMVIVLDAADGGLVSGLCARRSERSRPSHPRARR
jgi:hypothetical protein